MKYITVRSPEGELIPFFCLAPVAHATLAKTVARAGYSEPVSAGFVTFAIGGHAAICYGRSESLNLGPASGDREILGLMYQATRRLAQA